MLSWQPQLAENGITRPSNTGQDPQNWTQVQYLGTCYSLSLYICLSVCVHK